MTPPAGLLTSLSPGSRILFIRLRSLGDTVLSTPLYAALKAWRPDLRLSALVEEPFDEALYRNPDLDSVFPLQVHQIKHRSTARARWRTLRQIRRKRFDCCINLHGGTTSAWLTGLSGARFRIGLQGYRNSFCYNVRTELPSPPPGVRWHSARFQLEWLYRLGLQEGPDPPARLFPDPGLRSVLEARLRMPDSRPSRPVCVIQPSPLPHQGVDRCRICRDLRFPAGARLCHVAGRHPGGETQDQEGGRPLPEPACFDMGPYDLRIDRSPGSGQSVCGKRQRAHSHGGGPGSPRAGALRVLRFTPVAPLASRP